MTRIVSPEEFSAAFLKVARRRSAEIGRCWDSSPKFTLLCLDADGSLLSDIAKDLHLLYYPGGWSIDAILYERDDERLGEGYPEQLSVVIEHENAIGGARGGAHHEVNKLSIFNSPLKVLITYPYESTRHDRLAGYAEILQRADTFSDFSTKRRFVVIFGLWSLEDESVRWEIYVYRSGKFVPLGAKS